MANLGDSWRKIIEAEQTEAQRQKSAAQQAQMRGVIVKAILDARDAVERAQERGAPFAEIIRDVDPIAHFGAREDGQIAYLNSINHDPIEPYQLNEPQRSVVAWCIGQGLECWPGRSTKIGMDRYYPIVAVPRGMGNPISD